MQGSKYGRKGKTIVGSIAGLAVAASVAWAAAGNLDPTFGTGGVVTSEGSGLQPGACLQSDGRILMCGALPVGGTDVTGRAKSAWLVRRFNADGSIDGTFGTAGAVTLFGASDEAASRVAVDALGRILLAGRTTTFTTAKGGKTTTATYRTTLVRMTGSGSLDTSFGTGGLVHMVPPGSTGTSSDARNAAICVLPDGKIVAASRASFVVDRKGTTTMYAYVARFLDNGALDTSFATSGYGIDRRQGSGAVWGLARQSTGHFVLAQRGVTGAAWLITRHLPGGEVDTSFPTISTEDMMGNITVDGSDRILAAGRNTYPDGNFDAIVRRYTASGATDTTFGDVGTAYVHFGPKQNSWTVPALQSDGKIVIGVQLTDVPGMTGCATARLLDDGTLDTTYGSGGVSTPVDLGTGSNTASLAVLVAPNGGILSCGLGPVVSPGPYFYFVARYDGD